MRHAFGAGLLFVAVFAVPLIFFPATARSRMDVSGRRRFPFPALNRLVLLCKAAALVLLALVVLATAPLDATLKAAHALRVPGLLVQLTLLSYRYLFRLGRRTGPAADGAARARLSQPGQPP